LQASHHQVLTAAVLKADLCAQSIISVNLKFVNTGFLSDQN